MDNDKVKHCKHFYFLSGPSGWCSLDNKPCTYNDFFKKEYPELCDQTCRQGQYEPTDDFFSGWNEYKNSEQGKLDREKSKKIFERKE